MAREFGLIIELENDSYKEFLGYIKYIFEQGSSFILKYICINNLKMSSGERAFQNLFSWMNLLPHFNKISASVPKCLSANVLILIDEIDLYLHPEWQRYMLKCFIDTIGSQFQDSNIQVIFTTHSPIILSDIPRSNIIYLESQNGKALAYDTENETFASNIYNILNDGFYLDNAIGEFAFSTIENTINAIKRDRNIGESYIDYIIDIIGEPIIKEKIRELYSKFRNPDANKKILNEHESLLINQTIDLLEHQVKQLNRQIILLKEQLND